MALDDTKKYRINGEPVTAHRLIAEAACIDDGFDNDWLKSTSRAASILREYGYVVDENPTMQETNNA